MSNINQKIKKIILLDQNINIKQLEDIDRKIQLRNTKKLEIKRENLRLDSQFFSETEKKINDLEQNKIDHISSCQIYDTNVKNLKEKHSSLEDYIHIDANNISQLKVGKKIKYINSKGKLNGGILLKINGIKNMPLKITKIKLFIKCGNYFNNISFYRNTIFLYDEDTVENKKREYYLELLGKLK